MRELRYQAPPTVADFMASCAFVRAIVGPIGSGKSSGCVVEIPRRAFEQAAHGGARRSRWVAIRNTYRQLEDTTRKTFEQWVGGLGEWREKDFAFDIERRLDDGTTAAAEVLFRALDKPQDVKKILSLELTGAYFNELREVPKDLFDGVQGRVGRYPSMAEGGASWFGVWGDTNPWPTNSPYYELFTKERPEGFELFEQPGGRAPDAENVENLPPGYYARLCRGKDAEWISEYVDGQYPSHDKGSIYGELLDALERRGGVSDFRHPSDGVFATFDLGISDALAIWWWRLNAEGLPDFIDWYEATGKDAAHAFEVLDSKPYRLSHIWLPHDARARTFQTGVTTYEMFTQRYGAGRVSITPDIGIEDGLGATRWMLGQPARFHARCTDGLKRLRAYRYVWDEAKKVFSKKPLHDWTSHTADAARYVAVVARETWQRTKPAPTKPRPNLAAPERLTLDQLWEEHEESLAGWRR